MKKEDITLFGAVIQESGMSDYEWVELIIAGKDSVIENKNNKARTGRFLKLGTKILKKTKVI